MSVISRDHHGVTPVELFFDVVFVFALMQLSHHLAAHLSWHSAAETLVMLVAVFTVWSLTSWTAIIVPLDKIVSTLVILAALMASLFMNASIHSAFQEFPWAFVIPLIVVQFGLSLWLLNQVTEPG